jgi:putative acetyltransferase
MPDITFWSAWQGNELIGCGALKELDSSHAEIKSMRVSSEIRGRGIASQLLSHMLNEAKLKGYNTLSLETGSMSFFEPARKLYEKFGFKYCAPFADYNEDTNSVFMSLGLDNNA